MKVKAQFEKTFPEGDRGIIHKLLNHMKEFERLKSEHKLTDLEKIPFIKEEKNLKR